MFTILEGLNRFLGFFNLNLTFKNRLYIILGVLTTGYIGYLTINFFKYAAYKRAIVFLLIFLILLYFLVLNILYYYFDKSVKWDISRYFEKYVQVETIPSENQQKKPTNEKKPNGLYGGKMVIYDELPPNLATRQTLQVSVDYVQDGKRYVKQLVDFMLDNQLVTVERWEKRSNQKRHTPPLVGKNYRIPDGIEIPSFVLEKQADQLLLAIGLNATERQPVARVKWIGELPVSQVNQTYDVVATSAKIRGGAYLENGRANMVQGTDPYTIELEVVCLVKLSPDSPHSSLTN